MCLSSNHCPLLINPMGLDLPPQKRFFVLRRCGSPIADVERLLKWYGILVLHGTQWARSSVRRIGVVNTWNGGIKMCLEMSNVSWKRRKKHCLRLREKLCTMALIFRSVSYNWRLIFCLTGRLGCGTRELVFYGLAMEIITPYISIARPHTDSEKIQL